MESSGSTDDDDDEDFDTLLYSIVHHSMEGLPEERNIYVEPDSSPKISTLCHRIERSVSPQPTTSYCKVEEQKVCHSATVRSPVGDMDVLPYNEKTSTLTSEVRNKRSECLTRGKKSCKEQYVIDVITIESSDTECESVVEVPESGDSLVLPNNDKTDTLAINIRNKRRSQHLNMGKKGSEQEHIINIDGSDTECESELEVESVPSVSVGLHGAHDSMAKEGSYVMKSTCTKGEDPKAKKKKHNKGAKGTRNLRNISDYISPKSWTPEMRHFYSDSWGGENFDVYKVQKTMSDNPADWHVLDIDIVPHPRSRLKDRKKKCYNCNSWGHVAKFCPRPKRPIVCIFCGTTGHEKWKCPTPICLNCGEPSQMYKESCDRCQITKQLYPCSKCNKAGHCDSVCPDIWRKYYSVTSSEGLSAAFSETVYKPEKDQWCPNCTQRGHRFDECWLLAKTFYTSSESHNPLKRKLEFTEMKTKKKKKRKAKSCLSVKTVPL